MPRILVGLLALSIAACATEDDAPVRPDTSNPEAAAAVPLIAADAGLELVDSLVRDPRRGPLPDDSLLAGEIRYGYELVRHTADRLPENVGNTLSCSNCHMNAGQRDAALPWVGIAGLFPVSRGREGRLFSLEDRIGGCFLRSMNGTPPEHGSREMLAIVAYITWLSEGQPVGESPAWRGRNEIPVAARLPIERLDVARGEQVYQQCIACHGVDGQGIAVSGVKPGPLWGPDSWNDGAGMARIYTAAGFIRHAMPLTAPGSLSDEDAQHVAAFINAKERPAYPAKAEDYPAGAPVDAVYYPRYPEHPLRR